VAAEKFRLKAIKSERAVDGLLEQLTDESAEVRGRAAWALGTIKSERAVDGLLARLTDDSAAVRERAAWALGEIKSERMVDILLPWLLRSEYLWFAFGFVGFESTCGWAYRTILEILAQHARDPSLQMGPPEPIVSGPWSKKD
jgi:HEAT repeat protein